MTREEVMKLTGRDRDLAMIQNEHLWPRWPGLPMVRRDRAPGNMNLENCGFVIAGQGTKIFLGNLLIGPVAKAKPIQYTSWDGLLDEWRVD